MKKILPILILIFLIAVIPLALILTKQRQEIRKKAATNDINVYLNANTLSPNGTTSGGVIVQVGTPVVDTAVAHITYESAKLTLSNLKCRDGLTEMWKDTAMAGDIKIRCAKVGGFPTGPVAFALFDVTAGATIGDYNISLGENTQLVSNSNVVTGNKVPATLHVTTTAVPVFFSFSSPAVSPGGSNSGTVKLTAGSVAITTAKLVFTYDTSKVTISGLDCDGGFSKTIEPIISPGKAEVVCSSQAGVSGSTFNVAKFNVAVLSSASVGNVEFNFDASTTNSRLSKADSTEVPAQFTKGSFQVTQAGGATPEPGISSFTPLCASPGDNITVSGNGFGAERTSVKLTNSSTGSSFNVNIWGSDYVSWNNNQVVFKLPSITANGTYRITVNNFDSTSLLTVPCGAGGVTPSPTVSPTAPPTAPPNRPASLSLMPASNSVGSAPVLVEIRVNSGGRTVQGAQAVINVDPKLSIVNSTGGAATSIMAGDTSLTLVMSNSVSANKITFFATKQTPQTPATAINGVLAKFYVKTAQTSGTAILTFQTGEGETDSFVNDTNSVNILGMANSLTLNLGALPYFTPTCAVKSSTQITASGSGFGSSGNVILVTPAGGTANIAIGDVVSWSDAAVLFKVSSGFPLGQYTVRVNSISLNGTLTVAESCIVATPTPTAVATLPPGTTPTPTATVAPGTTFSFKLKFLGIDAKPTTPNVAGLDYGHEVARVTIKSGDTIIYSYPAILNAGDGGLYTSDLVVLADMRTTPFGNFPAGIYKLYVKPNYRFQKRFTGVVFPPAGVVDLTAAGYKFEAGDVDNNGVINLVDVNIVINVIQKQAAGTLTADDYNKSDYDRNGIINSGDTAAIFETMKIRYDDE